MKQSQIELHTVIKELYHISGFRISIHDTNLQEIAAYPKELSPFCRMLQQNPAARRLCIENDNAAFERVQQQEEVYLYRCQFGLYEAVAPLYHFGVLAGYLMMGQTLDALSDSKQFVYRAALPYVSNPKALVEEIARIPSSTKEKILSCITIMGICAEYITLGNRLNLNTRDLAHQVKKYIHQNYSQKISLELLCSHFFCSRATLSNTFKKIYQVSVMKYVNQVRLEQAALLLSESSLSIREIAERCGFSDQNYFCKVFLKKYSATPTVYRLNS